jgi:hypothetical protein
MLSSTSQTSRFRLNCSTSQNLSVPVELLHFEKLLDFVGPGARLDGQPSGQAIARRLREFQKKSGDTRRSRLAVTR